MGRKPADTKQLSFKIPNDLIRQAEELSALMPPMTTLDALRMAMARGLPQLLAEQRRLAVQRAAESPSAPAPHATPPVSEPTKRKKR